MIFDTDVLIWVQRGNERAARLVDTAPERAVSVQTYMELLQSARNKQQHQVTRSFLVDFGFEVVPFSENIGHRASVYVEEYALSAGMCAGDAIIAASAVERDMVLCTGNTKHFRQVRDLEIHAFRP